MNSELEVPPPAPRSGPGALSLFGWIMFFSIWIFLSVWPFIAPLNGQDEFVIPPGLLDDPVMVLIAIAGAWMSFVIAAFLAWRARLTRSDVGIIDLSPLKAILWSVGTLATLIGFWVVVSITLGERLDVVEALTQRPSGVGRWLLWISLAASAGICEEFVVRGYGIGLLKRMGANPWFGAILTSVIFGVLHIYQGPHAMVVIGVWGFLFAIPYVKSGSLLPGIIAHIAIDAIAPLFIE